MRTISAQNSLKQINKAVLAAAAALIFAVSLVGCSSNSAQGDSAASSTQASEVDEAEQRAALDSYVAFERAQLPEVMETYPDLYSDAKVESALPGSIIFTFTYAQYMDPEGAEDTFGALIPELQESMDSQVFPAMRSAGVQGSLRVEYVYLNSDGSLIWAQDFRTSN